MLLSACLKDHQEAAVPRSSGSSSLLARDAKGAGISMAGSEVCF